MGGDCINYPERWAHLQQVFCWSRISSIASFQCQEHACKWTHLKFLYHGAARMTQVCQIKLTDIHKEIIKEFKPHVKVTHDGFIYLKITRGIHCLPQVG